MKSLSSAAWIHPVHIITSTGSFHIERNRIRLIFIGLKRRLHIKPETMELYIQLIKHLVKEAQRY